MIKTGMVKTKQRELIIAAVQSSRSHPTADEVFQSIRTQLPTISLATVYRNLGTLSAQGVIRKIEIPDGRDRFDCCLADHDHFLCRSCGRLWDFQLAHPLVELIPPETGFLVQDYALVVRGTCRECAGNTPPAPSAAAYDRQ